MAGSMELDIVLPPDRALNAEQVADDEDDENLHFSKRVILNVPHFDSVPIAKGITIGKFSAARAEGSAIDSISGLSGSINLKFVPPDSPNEESRQIYIAREPSKVSPWKGWRAYDFVQRLTTVVPLEGLRKIDELTLKNITRAGISFGWEFSGSELYFHVFLKSTLVTNYLYEANIRDINKLYPFEDQDNNSLRLSSVVVLSQLIALAYPQYKKTILSAAPRILPEVHPLLKREHFDSFFEMVKLRREANSPNVPCYKLRLDGLTSVLRPYQKEAVRFMMHRELHPVIPDMQYLVSNIRLSGGLHFFPALGVFCRSIDDLDSYLPSVRGGILAEEMGLGKTVELLALILSLQEDNSNDISSDNGMVESEPCPLRETVDFLVSTVVASTEGKTGLKRIKAAQSTRAADRFQNAVFNLNTFAQSNRGTSASTIDCTECGTRCLSKNMHWKHEYTAAGINFLCPDCMAQGELLSISSTLIVVPQAILHQWYEEIRRHVREDVIIDVYLGVINECYKHPVYLSKYHIVLCAYETLKREMEFVEPVNERRILRKRDYEQCKRVSCPLVAVNWWRVCLDESQLVESASRNSTTLCRHLSSRAKWCVTGTPLVDSVNDLHGLVSFLGVYPLLEKNVWDNHLWQPWINETEPKKMLTLMSHIFWRRSKKDVQHQLNLPTVSHELVEVLFSPLEERLYSEKIRELRVKIGQSLTQLQYDPATLLTELPRNVLREIMDNLHELRLSIVTGDSHLKPKQKPVRHTNAALIRKDAMTIFSPDALFKRLFLKNKTELEDATRVMISNLNGLAGLCVLYRREDCLSKYQEVFQLERETMDLNTLLKLINTQDNGDTQDNSGLFRKAMAIDRTQVVHVCRNMLQLIPGLAEEGDRRELLDMRESLSQKEQENVQRYCRREHSRLSQLQLEWEAQAQKWEQFDQAFDSCIYWALILMDSTSNSDRNSARLLNELRRLGVGTEMSGVNSLFQFWLLLSDTMERKHGDIVELGRNVASWAAEALPKISSDSAVLGGPSFKSMMECGHNQMWAAIQKKESDDEPGADMDLPNNRLYFLKYDCPSCNLRAAIHIYQKEEQMVDQMGELIPLERTQWFQVFEAIHRFSSAPATVKSQLRQMRQRLARWFEMCRRTASLANQILDATQELISRHLELDEATSRFTVGMKVSLPEQVMHQAQRFHREVVLQPERSVDMQLLIRSFELAVLENKKSRDTCVTRIKYLNSLRNTQDAGRECPVCYSDVKGEWNVFPCAHLICPGCFDQLVSMTRENGHVRCVTCRQRFLIDTVSLVVETFSDSRLKPEEPAVPGMDLTVKFNAMVHRVRSLLDADFSNKILVFTSMNMALSPLCDVLKKAEIPFSRMTTKNGPESVAAFRNDVNCRVLVLPLSQGANGLNLTQANHVLFLEPVTDTSAISQAIGRMSRFGQLRHMTVHHLIVKGSIEEEIHRVVKEGANEEGWTIATLTAVLGL